MTNPRVITNWLIQRLDEMANDAAPLDRSNASYHNMLSAYILADIESKRRLVQQHQPIEKHGLSKGPFLCSKCIRDATEHRKLTSNDDCIHEHEPWPCNPIREALTPFAGQYNHPEWMPDGVDPDPGPQ